MKSLLLLRHAKSSWDDPSWADHERPLKKRGIAAARRMGTWMLEHERVPDRVLCSSAVRAQKTWRLVRQTWESADRAPVDVTTQSDLYECTSSQIRRSVAELADASERVLVIGHNPALQDLLAELTGFNGSFPTAALAHVDLPIRDWSEIAEPTLRGTLVGVWRPREIGE